MKDVVQPTVVDGNFHPYIHIHRDVVWDREVTISGGRG
jgi:hypothetical protein